MTPAELPPEGPFTALNAELNRPVMRALFWVFVAEIVAFGIALAVLS